jgi:hypothetical protein
VTGKSAASGVVVGWGEATTSAAGSSDAHAVSTTSDVMAAVRAALVTTTMKPPRQAEGGRPAGGARTNSPSSEGRSVGTGQATWLRLAYEASQLRDSAGFAPDFAEHRASR